MMRAQHLVVLRQLTANVTDHPEEQRWISALGFTLREFIRRLSTLDDATASLVSRVSVSQWGLWQRCLDAVRADPHALEFCWCRPPEDDDGKCRNCKMQITDTCD